MFGRSVCFAVWPQVFRFVPTTVAYLGMTDMWTLSWIAGPDAGGTTVLGHGSHVVGRAPGAAVRCDDGAVEPHHLLIEISAAGASVRQLTGRVPARVDGEPLSGALAIDTSVRFEIGHSILAMCRGDLTAPAQHADVANISATPAGEIVIRCPRIVSTWNPDALAPPADRAVPGDSTGGLLPAMLALGGSGLLALLMHQALFLLFGAIGAVAAFGTWGGQRINVLRRHTRDAHAHAVELARFGEAVAAQRVGFVEHRRANTATPVSARRAIERRTAELWARRGTHADGFEVSIGLGSVPWAPLLAESARRRGGPTGGDLGNTSMLSDLSLVAGIGGACRLAVRGDVGRTGAVVRSIVVQLVANCGPADVRFIVVTHEPTRWRWLQRLPHATTASGVVAVVAESELLDCVAESDVAPHPHLVVITDAPELLAARTSPLRRVVNSDRSTAMIVLVGGDGGVPHVCSSLLDVCGPVFARWHADAALSSLPVQARWFGISERSAVMLAGRLGGLVDPEDPLGGAGSVPRDVTMLSLLPSLDPAAIAAAWVAGGVDPPPRTVIGVAADGVVDIDLVRDGPHALLAGTTGAGKSELLRGLVAGLAMGSSPDHVTFVLIDYKGGATFDACADLPHVVGMVTDLDEHLANRALRSLHAELRRREQLLRRVGAADLAAYRRTAHDVLPRLVVVIDEFATLVNEQPDFLHALVGIAQRGRSLGVHLILATQRPSGVISDDIRANTNLRLALRLHDTTDALDVVGDQSPATIPRGLAGRAVMRLGPGEVLTFQTARCTAPVDDGGTELDAVVAAVRGAAALIGVGAPASPWLPPLPTQLSPDRAAIGRGTVGLVDDPDAQRTLPLRWSHADGHLLMVGAAGSGVTSALVLLGTAAVSARSRCHLYVIDGRGDPALSVLERSPWCAGVVRLHERERLIRLITRLADEVECRIAHPTSARHPIVVLVDGFDMVRKSIDELDTAAEFAMLETIVALGAPQDVVVICAFDRVASIPSTVLARCPARWIFHLTDPLDAAGLGIAAADVPGPQPGRVVVAATGLEAQLMVALAPLSTAAGGTIPASIGCLPAEVSAIDLPPTETCGADSLLPIGLRFDSGATCAIHVPDGEHLLIIGPARSGRSTALRRLVQAWRAAHPDGWWMVVAPRSSVFGEQNRHRSLADLVDAVPCDGRVLIAVDDAELVDDVGGVLAGLAASRRVGLMIVAAGKPDSLRHSYGHWTGIVRRSRLGIVTTAANDLDGDLLCADLPRRVPIAARPGLAWVISDGVVVLAQVAIDPTISAR